MKLPDWFWIPFLPFSVGMFLGVLITGLLMNYKWGCGLI